MEAEPTLKEWVEGQGNLDLGHLKAWNLMSNFLSISILYICGTTNETNLKKGNMMDTVIEKAIKFEVEKKKDRMPS